MELESRLRQDWDPSWPVQETDGGGLRADAAGGRTVQVRLRTRAETVRQVLCPSERAWVTGRGGGASEYDPAQPLSSEPAESGLRVVCLCARVSVCMCVGEGTEEVPATTSDTAGLFHYKLCTTRAQLPGRV